jgi:hypothetical protein
MAQAVKRPISVFDITTIWRMDLPFLSCIERDIWSFGSFLPRYSRPVDQSEKVSPCIPDLSLETLWL